MIIIWLIRDELQNIIDEFKASKILVDNKELADELLEKINAGEMTFEDAATAHSTCPSKDAGGNLGTFPRGQMVPEFEEAVFKKTRE